MNGSPAPQPTRPTKITTTLFDLISEMQQQAATPLDEALIVPTVVDLLRRGRIQFEPDVTRQAAA